MTRVTKLFVRGQICLYLGLILCVIIKPSGLGTNDGISYFGIYKVTILPYDLALLGPALFGLLAWRKLDSTNLIIKNSLLTFSILLVIIAFTPYSFGTLLDWLHTVAGTLLFLLQLVFSFWFVWKEKGRLIIISLALLELTAGIAAAFYVLPPHGFLLQAQVVFQLAFGILFTYVLAKKSSDTIDPGDKLG